MMMKTWVTFIAAGTTALLLIAAADEDSTNSINIAGQWSFTARIQAECTFGGTANLKHIGDNKYTGELTAQQDCIGMDAPYLVRQDCDASVLGNQVSVRCRIAEFINGVESDNYYPDNFALTVASPSRLFGSLVSVGAPNPAEWKRSESGIS